ncbi:MAG: lysophospholipase [Thermoflexales bacterium]|nr:lysophospholipase [Thermoflexales bacterium]
MDYPLLSELPPCEETTLASPISGSLFLRHWPAQGAKRGCAVLAHGIFEHTGRYHHIAQHFTALGFDVWAADHFGHGRSPGLRGHILRDDHYVADLGLVVEHAWRQSGAAPVLLGHSMGGAIAARYAVDNQDKLRGLILSAPALMVHASPLYIRVGKVISRLIPAQPMPPNSGLSKPATHNEDWEAWKRNDPYKHDVLRFGTARFVVEAGEYARARAHTLRLPVLILLAEIDTYVNNQGARLFFQALPPGSNELHEYPGLFHEVLSEIGREKPFGEIEAWMRRAGILHD